MFHVPLTFLLKPDQGLLHAGKSSCFNIAAAQLVELRENLIRLCQSFYPFGVLRNTETRQCPQGKLVRHDVQISASSAATQTQCRLSRVDDLRNDCARGPSQSWWRR